MAKADFVVQVTDEDILEAARGRSARCMVARAVRRANPDADRVMVDLQTIRYTDRARGERVLHLTPPAAQDLIVRFDAGELSACHPFDFWMRRRRAFRIQRALPATPAEREKRTARARAGEPQTGVKYVPDAPTGTGVIPKHAVAKRSAGATRSYGMRNLEINQARERNGDLPSDVEPVPGS